MATRASLTSTTSDFIAKGAYSLRARSERGVTLIGLLFWALLIGALVWTGYRVLPFYYYYYEIQGYMEAQASKAQVFSDDEIRVNVLQKIKELDIPLDEPDRLKINRFSGEIVIEFEYTEVLYFEYGEDESKTLWEFPFHPYVKHVI